MGETHEPWHSYSDPEELARALVQKGAKMLEGGTRRTLEAIRNHQLYTGRTIGGDSFSRDLGGDVSGVFPEEPIEQTLHVVQDVVDTLTAKIAYGEIPKPQMVITDGPWELKRKVEKCRRLVLGQMNLRQGKYFNHSEMYGEALRMALAATGTSAIKYFSDPEMGKVCCEVHDTLNMWVDSGSQPYDAPLSMGVCTYWSPEKLCAIFPEQEEQIKLATVTMQGEFAANLFDYEYDHERFAEQRRVLVHEGWRFKYRGTPGKHAMALASSNGHCLLRPKGADPVQAYDYEEPPFVFVGGVRNITGHWHRPLTHTLANPSLRVNEILQSINNSERLTPKGVVFYDPETTPEEKVEEVDDYQYIPVPGLNMGAKPHYEAPPPFHPSVMALLDKHLDACYTLPGVSQMHTAGTREKGLTSGVALRVVKDLINERHAPIQRQFINASVIQATKQILRCAKEVASASGGFTSQWEGEEFLQEIDAKSLSVLDDNPYNVREHAVSETSDSPEDRASLAEELVSMGIISGESYVSALQHFDVVKESKAITVHRKFMDKQIDKWRMAEPEDLSSRDFFSGPIPTLDTATLMSSLVYMNNAIVEAMYEEVENRRLKFFRKYLAQLKGHLDRRVVEMQKASSGGAPAGVSAPPGHVASTPAQAAQPA